MENGNSYIEDDLLKGHNDSLARGIQNSSAIDENDETLADVIARIKENKYTLFDSLTSTQVAAYSVGHFMNDLTAAVWFNYLLYYLTYVLVVDPNDAAFYAGIVMLSGQIADGLATPVAGALSDKTRTRFGKRKPWYIAGTIMVAVCFIFIFQPCFFCSKSASEEDQKVTKIIYYVMFPSLFNVGWAFVQIAHMSLVPSLTVSKCRRDSLNNFRNTLTYVANFGVLGFALVLFTIISKPEEQFQALAFSVIGIGMITSIFFMWKIDEVHLTQECQRKLVLVTKSPAIQAIVDQNDLVEVENKVRNSIARNAENGEPSPVHAEDFELAFDPEAPKIRKSLTNSMTDQMPWTAWFKEKDFYLYGIVYMCTRITVNVCSSMLQFYLVNVLKVAKEDATEATPPELAFIPITLYASSVVASWKLCTFYKLLGKKVVYTIGLAFLIISSVILMILTPANKYYIYGCAVYLGFGQSICLNTALNFISEVIGLRGASGAFVFGAYSFADKVACGIILFLAMGTQAFSDRDETFLRMMTACIPSAAALVGWFIVILGQKGDTAQSPSEKPSPIH